MENVALPMMFQRTPQEKRKKKAKKLLEQFGLGERTNHKPSELSGGQQQRVAIARSLSNDPDVILADEPTGNLDSKTGKIIIDFLRKVNDDGKTVVMITHDPHLARLADRTELLKDGTIRGKKGEKK